jgi:hypothetical protein
MKRNENFIEINTETDWGEKKSVRYVAFAYMMMFKATDSSTINNTIAYCIQAQILHWSNLPSHVKKLQKLQSKINQKL